MVLAQLATPVLLATALQTAVLMIAWWMKPVPMVTMVASAAVFLPLNVMIFGLDNLLFLWFPHRQNEEGIEVFLRATLTFTGKGLLFAVGLAITVVWAFVAAVIARSLGCEPRAVFFVGSLIQLTALAATVVALATRAFPRCSPAA